MPGSVPHTPGPNAPPSFGVVKTVDISYPALVLGDGAALYWRLEESTGTTAADETGNGRVGTYAGGYTLGAMGALNRGVDRAVDLDGISGRITSTYNPFTNGTVRSFECWAWLDTPSDVFMFAGDGANVCDVLEVDGSSPPGDLYFRATAGVGTLTIWFGAWPGTSQWVHTVLVFDEPGDIVSLYINGALVSTQANTGTYGASPGNFLAGRRGNGASHWDGKLDEIAVYEYALTPAQILAHYNAGIPSPIFEASPVGGAIAAGVGPVAQAAVSQGGAVAGGVAPTVQASVASGGAVGAGSTPVARASVPQGGGIAGGSTPLPQVAVPQGGAVGTGSAPTTTTSAPQGGALGAGLGATAKVGFSPGGAVGGGIAPGESTPGGENVPRGGAVAAGFVPAALATVPMGGGVGLGVAPAPQVVVSSGGAIAGGRAPTEPAPEEWLSHTDSDWVSASSPNWPQTGGEVWVTTGGEEWPQSDDEEW